MRKQSEKLAAVARLLRSELPKGRAVDSWHLALIQYLAERKVLETAMHSIVEMQFANTHKGPVGLAMIQWLQDGCASANSEIEADPDVLQDYESNAVRSAMQEFGSLSVAELGEYFAAQCREWKAPASHETLGEPLPFTDIWRAQGFSEPDIKYFENLRQDEEMLDKSWELAERRVARPGN